MFRPDERSNPEAGVARTSGLPRAVDLASETLIEISSLIAGGHTVGVRGLRTLDVCYRTIECYLRKELEDAGDIGSAE